MLDRRSVYEVRAEVISRLTVVSLSWCQATIWDQQPVFYIFQGNYLYIVAFSFYFGAPPLSRGWICNLQL
jgi:hypothetical protein